MDFHGEELLAPRPTPKLEDHQLSAVRDCIQVWTGCIWLETSGRLLWTR